jgi:hypothetical protein
MLVNKHTVCNHTSSHVRYSQNTHTLNELNAPTQNHTQFSSYHSVLVSVSLLFNFNRSTKQTTITLQRTHPDAISAHTALPPRSLPFLALSLLLGLAALLLAYLGHSVRRNIAQPVRAHLQPGNDEGAGEGMGDLLPANPVEGGGKRGGSLEHNKLENRRQGSTQSSAALTSNGSTCVAIGVEKSEGSGTDGTHYNHSNLALCVIGDEQQGGSSSPVFFEHMGGGTPNPLLAYHNGTCSNTKEISHRSPPPTPTQSSSLAPLKSLSMTRARNPSPTMTSSLLLSR